MTLADYIAQVQFLVHDSTNADFSQLELTNAINNARTAVALDFHCVRQMFLVPPNNAPASRAYQAVGVVQNTEAYRLISSNGFNGQIVGGIIVAGGINYSPATTVTFAPSGNAGAITPTCVPIIVVPTFVASIVGTTMTVTGMVSTSTPLLAGQLFVGTGVLPGTIVNQLTGTPGGAGTYTVSPSQSVPAGTAMSGGTPGVPLGVITGLNMTFWGEGYTPRLRFDPLLPSTGNGGITVTDPGGGSGANILAVMFNNVFNVISISYIWGNQRYMLKFRGFTLFQAYMRALLTFTQRALIWTIHEQTGTVLIQPPPDQPYQSEWDVLCLPLPFDNTVPIVTSQVDTQVIQPWADAVQYYAAMLCLNKLQNFEQAEYYLKLYSARVPKIIVGAGGIRIPNPYHRTFQRRVAR